MKIIFLLVASIGAALASHVGWGDHADSPMNLEPRVFLARDSAGWKEFRNQYGHLRQFRNSTEEEFHARIFQDSEAMVKAQNDKFARGESGFDMALNHFADMTEAEYRALLPPISHKDVHELQSLSMPFVKTNEAHGRRKRDVNWQHLTPTVKDQGICGSCYAFAAVDALEAAIKKKTGVQYRLSEQDLVDCSGPQGNFGCNGGNMITAFNYIKSAGINLEANYPYTGAFGSCRHNAASNVKANLTGYAFFGWPNGDEPALQKALSTVGPIAIGLNANRSFMMYSKGVFDEPDCDPEGINHAVMAVGMASENGKPYYLIKNSWGTWWGDRGYIRMAAGKDLCGLSRMCSYPVLG